MLSYFTVGLRVLLLNVSDGGVQKGHPVCVLADVVQNTLSAYAVVERVRIGISSFTKHRKPINIKIHNDNFLFLFTLKRGLIFLNQL